MIEQLNAPAWSDQQRATFYYRMAAVQKDEVLGVLLAVFLGSFGLHHFYIGRNGLGKTSLLRMILGELARICDHLTCNMAMCMELAAVITEGFQDECCCHRCI